MRTEMHDEGRTLKLAPQTMGDGFQLGVLIGSLADAGELAVGKDYSVSVPVGGRLKVDPAAPPKIERKDP